MLELAGMQTVVVSVGHDDLAEVRKPGCVVHVAVTAAKDSQLSLGPAQRRILTKCVIVGERPVRIENPVKGGGGDERRGEGGVSDVRALRTAASGALLAGLPGGGDGHRVPSVCPEEGL